MGDDPSITIDRRTIEANLRDPSPDDQSSGGGAGGAAPPLNYRDFAWLAETLDGRRDEYVKIIRVMENGRQQLVVKNNDYALAPGETLVLDGIRTDSWVPKRPEVTVTISIEGAAPTLCRTDGGLLCDAVFCSESAIEKFVFPYYHSQRLLTAAELATLTAEVRDPSTMAVGHAHPSRSKAFHRESPFYALTNRAKKGMLPDLYWKRLV